MSHRWDGVHDDSGVKARVGGVYRMKTVRQPLTVTEIEGTMLRYTSADGEKLLIPLATFERQIKEEVSPE